MTERLSSLHDPYNGCVDLQHNYSDNRDWWLFISRITSLIACQWRVARNGEQKENWKVGERESEKWDNTFSFPVPLPPVLSCFFLLTFLYAAPTIWMPSLRGRRSQGKGKGRARREVSLSPSSRASRVSLAHRIPFTSPVRAPATQATKRLEKAKSLKARVWSLDHRFIIVKLIRIVL